MDSIFVLAHAKYTPFFLSLFNYICFHLFSLCLFSVSCVINMFYWLLCKYETVHAGKQRVNGSREWQTCCMATTKAGSMYIINIQMLRIWPRVECNLSVKTSYYIIKTQLIQREKIVFHVNVNVHYSVYAIHGVWTTHLQAFVKYCARGGFN